ncbi:MAG: 6-carboxytetrahydropterin synthase [Caulobacterales bacterium]|nr:6-carboxytetrahydropterin synthase [Caulobacterales bacterium]
MAREIPRIFNNIDTNELQNAQSGHHYGVLKDYNYSLGLSVCFRQWSDETHCRFLHGYALKISIEFAAIELDNKNWVVPFGGLKEIKSYLISIFDHKTLIAQNDPELENFKLMHQAEMIDMIIVPAIGIEIFARLIFKYIEEWLSSNNFSNRIALRKVTIREHDGNGAYYENNKIEFK